MIQHLVGPAPLPVVPNVPETLSILSYNVLLPNSVDGWWNYKMYLPPLGADRQYMSEWEFRKDLLRERIALVDADVVCLQEVSPLSFEEDFAFMESLGYDKEMFKRGRFRPATFWKSSRCELVSPPVHKDRTLLTAFRVVRDGSDLDPKQKDDGRKNSRIWYVLNSHLQAGKQGRRRVRQIVEGSKAVMTLARKLKDPNPERNVPLIVCGDFNGGEECGAIRYLEDGFIDEHFMEDGEPVVSGKKALPLEVPLRDVMAACERGTRPPGTLVVPELISTMVQGAKETTDAYENPVLSTTVLERLDKIYDRFATHVRKNGAGGQEEERVMNVEDVEAWLIAINGEVGRGSEFREAAHQMGYKEDEGGGGSDSEGEQMTAAEKKKRIALPRDGTLSRDGFVKVYQDELSQGKFWGIAHDLAALGEPLPDAGVFQSRYDRIYCSAAVQPTAVMDFVSSDPCPNEREPSDHLPVAASFQIG